MPAMLIAWLIRRGLSSRAARIAAYILTIAATFALLAALWATWLHFHDASVIDRHEAKIDAKAAPASEAAASERANDITVLSTEEARAHDAIHAAAAAQSSDTPLAPTTIALGCARLRRAHRDLPAACRH